MDRYYNEKELKFIEESPIPCMAFQLIDDKVVTQAISKGYLDLLNVDTMEEAYHLMNTDMFRDVHPDDLAVVTEEAIRFGTEGGDYDMAYRTKLGDDYIIIHSKGTHIYKPNGERIAIIYFMNEGVYRDIGKETVLKVRQQFENFIQSKEGTLKGDYDKLTGMPNLNYFFELAEIAFTEAFEVGRKIYMLFMDLGGMKAYNQKYGYAEGDKLIKAAAKVLVNYFGNENCCRVTADHFAVFSDHNDFELKLANLIEDAKHINNCNTLPLRIGICESGTDYVSATTACDRAKIACDSIGSIFESKIVYFDLDMLKKFEARRYIFENLDRAISEGWIKVYYQAIVRSASGKVCDEEALVRWIDPERGVIPPLDFIPILEDANISYKLDLYVLEQVLEKLKNQAAEGIEVVPNSINLSRADFYACDMVEEIRRRVDESGVDRSKITIEITESVIMNDVDSMKTQVERFRELGFSVWMDDFGSGYSSPDILQKIHFDVIKLDKLFVDGIEQNEGSRILVSTFISLARGLGSDVVAEGIETARQVVLLKEMECSKLQGYYYSKPVPLETIIERTRLGTLIGFETEEEADRFSPRRW